MVLPWCRAEQCDRQSVVVRSALASLGIAASIVSILGGTPDGETGDIDWTAVVDARMVGHDTVVGDLWWTDLSEMTLPLAYQREAVSLARWLADPDSSAPSFARFGWLEAAAKWICETLGSEASRTPLVPSVYKASPTRAVVGFNTSCGTFYVKAEAPGSTEEHVTRYLEHLHPSEFPRVVSVNAETGWWLTAALPGRPLHQVSCEAVWFGAGEELAAVQARLRSHSRRIVDLGVPIVPLRDLQKEIEALVGELSANRDEDAPPREARLAISERDCADTLIALSEACTEEGLADPPLTWLHTDPAPSNILDSSGKISFIDLSDSVVGPAHLPAGVFVLRLSSDASLRGRAFLAGYARGWSRAGIRFKTSRMGDLRILAHSLDIWLQNRQLERRRTAREIVCDAALTRRRLARRLVRRVRQER